jgi:hypothetical protein
MKSNIIRGAAALLLALAFVPTGARTEQPDGAVTALKEPVALSPTAPQSPTSLRAEVPDGSVAALTEPVEIAKPDSVHPFAAMAGSWTGGGTISLLNDINEKLRCRANHSFAQGTNSLSLSIRCSSDNYKFELTSNVVERRGQVSGRWNEASYGVSGTISGRVTGNRISAMAQGDKFTTALSVTTTGNRQTVSITPQATYVTSVQIALSRR